MVKNTTTSGTSSKKSRELTAFADPLITLLHSANLNKDKELTDTLCEYIDEISDSEVKQWCIDSLTLLRDLEKIEIQLDQWEFHTLDFTLEVANENAKMRTNLANRVLEKSTNLRNLLSNQRDSINLTIDRSKKLSKNVHKIISDAGTILVELTLRIVRLGKSLDQQVTIGYSRAKLTIIGSELKKLVTLDPTIIDQEIVANYTIFVDNLLNQLNMAVAHNDTVGLWESVAIIGDVEKMFETMKQTTSMAQKEREEEDDDDDEDDVTEDITADMDVTSPSLHEEGDDIVETVLNTDTTLVNSEVEETSKSKEVETSEETPKETPVEAPNEEPELTTTVSKVSTKDLFTNDKELVRTKVTEHIPELMQAFNKKEPVKKKSKKTKTGKKKQEEKPVEKAAEATLVTPTTPASPSSPTTPDAVPVADGANTGYFSYFKPSILNAFYQPQMKEPIYINKQDLPGGKSASSPRKQIQGSGHRQLKNASIAVKLDQISFEERAKQDLLDREKGLRNKEAVLDSHLLNGKSATQRQISTSPLLQQLASSNLLCLPMHWYRTKTRNSFNFRLDIYKRTMHFHFISHFI